MQKDYAIVSWLWHFRCGFLLIAFAWIRSFRFSKYFEMGEKENMRRGLSKSISKPKISFKMYLCVTIIRCATNISIFFLLSYSRAKCITPTQSNQQTDWKFHHFMLCFTIRLHRIKTYKNLLPEFPKRKLHGILKQSIFYGFWLCLA